MVTVVPPTTRTHEHLFEALRDRERERDRCPATALFLCHSTSPARCHSKSLHHLVLPPHLSLFFFFFFYCLARMAVCVCVRVIGLWCGMLLGRLHCVAVIHPHSFFFLFHFFFFFSPCMCDRCSLSCVIFLFIVALELLLIVFFFFFLSLYTLFSFFLSFGKQHLFKPSCSLLSCR